MDANEISPEKARRLHLEGFKPNRARHAWVKQSLGRVWAIPHGDVMTHDLAWLKGRIVEFAMVPLDRTTMPTT